MYLITYKNLTVSAKMKCFSKKVFYIFCTTLSLLSGMSIGGRLELNPKIASVTKLAGDDKSFFVSCIPHSDIGAVGDSRIRAKNLEWKKKQKPPIGNNWVVMGSEQYSRVHVEESADGRGRDLVFRSLQVDDEGEYSCEAIIDGMNEKKIFYLKVIEPISFEATNQVQSVENGSGSHTLTCKVTGKPKPRVTWNVRGNIMRSGYDDGKYRVTPDGLVIRNITQNDKGAYKCKATQIGEDITDFQDMIIQLRVQHEPIWTAQQRSIFYGFISGTSNLTCGARAEPPATFTWYDKIGKPIQKGAILTENHISTLVLPVTHDGIFGEYSCKASNKMGTLTRQVRLSEGAKPGIPTLSNTEIENESVQMKILEHPAELHLGIIGFEIEYKEEDWEWDLAYHQYLHLSPFNLYKVSGLMPKTVYIFRARARNLAGYSDHSNLILLQTSATHAVRELLGSAASSANAGIMAGNSKSVILKQSQPLFNMVLLMNTVLIIKHQFLETNTQL